MKIKDNFSKASFLDALELCDVTFNRTLILKNKKFRIKIFNIVIIFLIIILLIIPSLLGLFNADGIILDFFVNAFIPDFTAACVFLLVFYLLAVICMQSSLRKYKNNITEFNKDGVIDEIESKQKLISSIDTIEGIVYGKRLIYIFYKKSNYVSVFSIKVRDKFEEAAKLYLKGVKKYYY